MCFGYVRVGWDVDYGVGKVCILFEFWFFNDFVLKFEVVFVEMVWLYWVFYECFYGDFFFVFGFVVCEIYEVDGVRLWYEVECGDENESVWVGEYVNEIVL